MAKADTADTKIKADKTVKADKPAKAGKPGRAAKAAKPGIFARIAQYFRDVRSEMKRVVWPSRPEVKNMFFVVLVTLIFFVFFTWAIDTVVVLVLQTVTKIG